MSKHKAKQLPTKQQTLTKALTTLRKRKVTAIKVELEASTGRDTYESLYQLRQFLDMVDGNACYDDYDYDNYAAEYVNPLPYISYIRLYNDGSVDTEVTMTIPLYDPDGNPSNEGIEKLPVILRSFKLYFGDDAGSHFSIERAGLHIAALFSKDYSYPSPADDYTRREYSHSKRLHAAKLRNFKSAMTELLPALYFLGTTNSETRELQYRRPNVSVDFINDGRNGGGYYDNPKYSAISYRNGALEFRVFDTCYDSPEQILDYIVVMSNAMKFLTIKHQSTGILDLFEGSIVPFGNNSSRKLERFYGASVKHIDALNKGLYLLKPAYYTYRDLKKQRGFKLTKQRVMNVEKDVERKARKTYKTYKQSIELLEEARKKYLEHDFYYSRLSSALNHMDNITPRRLHEILERLAQDASEYADSPVYTKRVADDIDTFIRKRIDTAKAEYQPEYRIVKES